MKKTLVALSTAPAAADGPKRREMASAPSVGTDRENSMSEGEVEELLQIVMDTAAMLRGMTMDPAIPEHAKGAMRLRIVTLESWGEWVAE